MLVTRDILDDWGYDPADGSTFWGRVIAHEFDRLCVPRVVSPSARDAPRRASASAVTGPGAGRTRVMDAPPEITPIPEATVSVGCLPASDLVSQVDTR